MMVRVFKRPGFNPRSSHTKDSKMLLDASLLNTQQYKIGIKSKVEQSRERSRKHTHIHIHTILCKAQYSKIVNISDV